MFLSNVVRSFVVVPAGLAIWMLSGGSAWAQPRIPADAKGYQTAMILQKYHQKQGGTQAAARVPTIRPARPASVVVPEQAAPSAQPVQLVISTPPEASQRTVVLRGPDGQLREFPLPGGAASIVVRDVTVRPGQSVTVQIIPAPR